MPRTSLRMAQALAVHSNTPTLAVIDPRGLGCRAVDYYRREPGTPAQARVSAQWHDTSGRAIADWDPRQFARFQAGLTDTPNTRSSYSLSGRVLQCINVDAGLALSLNDGNGLLSQSWNGHYESTLTQYDALLRPVAVIEESSGQTRTVERFSYTVPDMMNARLNLCGRVRRHDHTSGTLHVDAYGLQGENLQETRHLLTDIGPSDWPVDESARDALLEPGDGYRTHCTVDATGAVLAFMNPVGNVRRHQYCLDGGLRYADLESTLSGTHRLLDEATYDAQARLVLQIAGNGVVTESAFCPASGLLLRLTARRPGKPTLQDLSYLYDPVGNTMTVRDEAQPVRHFANQRIDPVSHYRYDSLYQLIEATGQEAANSQHGPDLPGLQPLPTDPANRVNYVQYFEYDAGGNMLQVRHVGASNRTQRLAIATGSNRSLPEHQGQLPSDSDIATSFDACGNLLELQPGQALHWNTRAQLQRVTPVNRDNQEHDDETYLYDAQGSRVRKITRRHARHGVNTAQVHYLPGLEIHTDSSTAQVLHVLSASAGRAGVRLLQWVGDAPTGQQNGQLRYAIDNALGSCSLELDAQANLISREDYYPFAGTACWSGRSAVEARYKTHRYSGKERDASGLYYYGLRYYAPWLQRWISTDPAGEIDGLNLYRMVGNNPMTLTDTDGRMGQTWQEGVHKLLHDSAKKERRGLERSERNRRYEHQFVVGVHQETLKHMERNSTIVLRQLGNDASLSNFAKSGGRRVVGSVVQNTLSAGGSVLGGAGGAFLGSAAAPGVGTVVGGTAGAFLGSKAGSVLGDKINHSIGLGGSLAPEPGRLNVHKIKKDITAGQDLYASKIAHKVLSYIPVDNHGYNKAAGKNIRKEAVKYGLNEVAEGAKYLVDVVEIAQEAFDVAARTAVSDEILDKIMANGTDAISTLQEDMDHVMATRYDAKPTIKKQFLAGMRKNSDFEAIRPMTYDGLAANTQAVIGQIGAVVGMASNMRQERQLRAA